LLFWDGPIILLFWGAPGPRIARDTRGEGQHPVGTPATVPFLELAFFVPACFLLCRGRGPQPSRGRETALNTGQAFQCLCGFSFRARAVDGWPSGVRSCLFLVSLEGGRRKLLWAGTGILVPRWRTLRKRVRCPLEKSLV
jgi:hypothetical protein